MATTKNLNLKKPADTDAVLVAELNENADKVDAAIGKLGDLGTSKKGCLVDAINETKVSADNAASDASAAKQQASDLDQKIGQVSEAMGGKIDGAYEENGYLYLTSGGEVIAGPLGPFGGSGGGTGGGSSGYLIALVNLLDSRNLTAAGDGAVNLKFRYTSADENENDDGPGVGTLTVNGVKKATLSVPQGENTLDVSAYLSAGSNTVKLKVENSEGLSRTLSYTVTVITLGMSTTFEEMGVYSGSVVFNYTVTGSGSKTVHFLMDGTELGTETVTSSGRSRSYAVAAQSAGAHTLTAYASMTVDGVTVRSNTLTIGMLWVTDDLSAPAILCTFDRTTATQGEILTIPYMVYDPQGETAAVTLEVVSPDGSVYSTKALTVDRTRQTWVVQDYPKGAVKFRLRCGTASVVNAVTVAESAIVIEPVTDAMTLCFDPTGRSNQEASPASWSSGDISASFSGVGFSAADGWRTDADGAALLRLLPGGQMTIPFKPFAADARTTGLTVEVEMSTHNVRDYDTVVLSCLSGGRGFKIASQYAEIASEQSDLSMQFKEDEKVRVSFVVEPRTVNRLILVYVDGIMCGAIQYPEDDNFAQSAPVGLTVGAGTSGIDIYRIRLYSKGLSRHEILDNYIADRPLLSERMAAYQRNDILDQADDIVISKLPATLPYMIIKCAELPQYKGDKKTCEIEYVDPADSARSFTASGVQIDVQGTSSAGYKKKNWKLKLNSGVTYTASGESADLYQLRADSLAAKVFCMKADVASSEGANNVELVRLYNDTVPYKTPPQQANEKVRVGIDGLPCVIFWQNTATNAVRFWGKYNFNFDKSAEAVYGLAEGCESWEVKNNTSNRVLFKTSDFGTGWTDDFEARYPDGNEDYTRLKALCDWIASTNRSAATGAALAASVTYGGTAYTNDTAAYRLAKFKAEFEDHFVKIPTLFYYLYTEVFLMVDSRAKNFFPSTFDGTHWLPLPYDMDTAIGINNEGQLVFDYDLEDTDTVGGNNVFNGQDSVLWCNVRDAFSDDIAAMYRTLRSGELFNYAHVVQRYAAHQAVWPEAVWNEDSWEKYLEPLENDNDAAYLTMLQGSKASQREWWLYNGFRYRDSKYQTGDAASSIITLRCYAVGDITVTPYSHIWPRIKYGSYTVTKRGKRNVACKLENPMDTMNDTEVYIYSADRLAAIGDLSPIQVGYANFSMATKLQSLKLGDGADDYENAHLTELYTGNNELLTALDVQNCSALAMTVDLSGCVGIETVKAKGSAVTGFTLPVGGKLKTMELPGTVTNLTIRDQAQFTTLTMAGYTALTTLRIENTPNIPLEAIINGATALNRVRLLGVSWSAASETTLQATITRLKSCIGMDAAGSNTAAAVVTGRVYVPSVSAALLTEINEAFPNLVVVANSVPQYIVRYLDWDNTVLYRAVVAEGADAVNAVTAGYITAPTREGTEDTHYTFKDFGTLPTDIHQNETVIAQYTTLYRVRFMNGDTAFDTQWVAAGGSAATPTGTPTKASTAQYIYTFSGWSGSYASITGPVDVTATFTSTVRTYTVRFYNGTTLLQTVENVAYGGTATYTGTTPVDPSGDGAAFEGWAPSNTNITGDTDCKAKFASLVEVAEISDSWEVILAACADGTYSQKYKVGNYKPLDLGSKGTVNMQIAGFDVDDLADGTGKAPVTWMSRELLDNYRMNPRIVEGTSAKYVFVADPDTGENAWTLEQNADCKGTWTVKMASAGTLKIKYMYSGLWYSYITLKVDGTSILSSATGSKAWTEYEVTCEAEQVVTVTASYTQYSKSTDGTVRVAFESEASMEITQSETFTPATPGTEGTGALGGWGKCERRTRISGQIKPLIPAAVRDAIKTVTKTQAAYDAYGTAFTQTTQDAVWIPAYPELSGDYKALFLSADDRKKALLGQLLRLLGLSAMPAAPTRSLFRR